jgi:hypothetical protein
MSTKFYAGQKDYIDKLNAMDDGFQQAIADAGDIVAHKNAAATSAANAASSETNAGNSAASAGTSATTATNQANTAITANTNAQAALAGTASAAAQAANARDQAIYASQVATAGNENLAAIAKTFHTGAIVKTFLYDTSKDSDGGQWRKRTQAASWFTEAINGAWLGEAANELAARGDNIVPAAEQLDQWAKNTGVTVVTNSASSNVGNAFTLDKIVEGTVSQEHWVRQNIAIVSGKLYAMSFEAKAGEKTRIAFYGSGGYPVGVVRVNLATGVVEAGTATVTLLPNGNYQITAMATATATGTGLIWIEPHNGTSGTYVGDGVSGVYVGNVKVNEVGALSSTYSASQELIANGGFDNGLASWTITTAGASTGTVVNGVLNLTGDGTNTVFASQGFSTVAGKVYRLSHDGNVGGSTIARRIGTTLNGSEIAAANVPAVSDSVTFTATGATTYVTFLRGAGTPLTVMVDNVSIKEVTVLATPYVPYSALTNSYYHNTTDGKFYSLGATYGTQVETFRGSKREFPATALIVAEASKIVIYDATDPLLSMWMVFINATGTLAPSQVSSIYALNGLLIVGSNATFGAARMGNFISDSGKSYRGIASTNNSEGYWRGTLSQRNANIGFSNGSGGNVLGAIASDVVNDVTATVLPDAPSDPATGLPIPTVYVATTTGVSRIAQDGTVSSTATTSTVTQITIDGSKVRALCQGGGTLSCSYDLSKTLPAGSSTGTFHLNSAWIEGILYGASVPALLISGSPASRMARSHVGTSYGLNLVKENPSVLSSGQPVKSMVAYITNAYNSGWQVGDSRAAFLCDVVPEVITASGELVTNGSFVADTTGWTPYGGGTTIAIVNGELEVTATGTDASPRVETSIATVVGKQYTLSVTGHSTGAIFTRVASVSGQSNIPISVASLIVNNGTATQVSTFTAISTTTYINFLVPAGAGSKGYFDNVSCKETAGVELNADPGFDNPASWNVQDASIVVANGKATFTNTPAVSAVYQARSMTGKQQTVTIVVNSITAGGLQAQINGTAVTLSVGTNTFVVTANAAVTTGIYSVGTTTAEVESFSIRETQNLILNGTFTTDTSNWAFGGDGTVTVTAGQAVFTNGSAGGLAGLRQSFTTVVGRQYQVSVDIASGTVPRMYAGTTEFGTTSSAYGIISTIVGGKLTCTFVATTTTTWLRLEVNSAATGTTFTADNVSVKDTTELVQNGAFEGMTTGWSQGSAFPSLANCVNGELIVTPNVAFGAQLFSIPTVVGKTYKVQGNVRRASGTGSTAYLSQAGSTGLDITLGPFTTSATAVPLSFDFTATATTSYIAARVSSVADTGGFDNITCKLAEADRSVKANGLIVVGSLTKQVMATGGQVVGYRDWSGPSGNYLEQPYNSGLDFGTGDFAVIWWENISTAADQVIRFARGSAGSSQGLSTLNFIVTSTLTYHMRLAGVDIDTGVAQLAGLNQIVIRRQSGVLSLWVNNSKVFSVANSTDLTNTSALLRIGTSLDAVWSGPSRLAMMRFTTTAPSDDQIAKMYRDELALFQANAKCTIDGTSSAVTALAYGEDTDLLHVGTSWGRSTFQNLLRVESSATVVGALTALSAGNGAHITGGATAARFVMPVTNLRDEFRRKYDLEHMKAKQSEFDDIDTALNQTTFTLPLGWKPKNFFKDSGTGLQKQREGTGKAWTRSFDGFRWTITIPTAYATNTWVQIERVRDL